MSGQELTWEDEVMAAQILAAISENQPNPLDWCQESECPSFYLDELTRKPHPCPHKVKS